MNEGKGFIFVPLLVILLVIIVGVGGYILLGQKVKTTTNTERGGGKTQDAGSVPNDFQTYINSRLGYSIEYPVGWVARESTQSEIVYFSLPDAGNPIEEPVPAISIEFINRPFEIVSEPGKTNVHEVSFSGLRGYRYDTYDVAPFSGRYVVLEFRGGMLQFFTPDRSDLKSLFGEMINSFRTNNEGSGNHVSKNKTNFSISGQVYRDDDCDQIKDSGEVGIPKVTVNVMQLPEYKALVTATTDSNGMYSFSKDLKEEESIIIQPVAVSPLGYQSHPKLDPKYGIVTLSKDKPSTNIDLPQLPYESISKCK